MIDDLTLAMVAEKLRSIARETDRDEAEGEAARMEYALTQGDTDVGAGDVELLALYLIFLATGHLDDLPAESHAGLLERLASNPGMLSAQTRVRAIEQLSPRVRERLREVGPEVLADVFTHLDDAICRYLCVSTALLYDTEVLRDASTTDVTPSSMIERFVRRAANAESSAPLLINELTEALLDVWTHPDLRNAAEDGLRRIVAQARQRQIGAEYFENAIRAQARLFEPGDGDRLEDLLRG